MQVARVEKVGQLLYEQVNAYLGESKDGNFETPDGDRGGYGVALGDELTIRFLGDGRVVTGKVYLKCQELGRAGTFVRFRVE